MIALFKEDELRTVLLPILFLAFMLFLAACDSEVEIPDGALTEQTVDIEGEWRVVRAYQNQQDITDQLDFSNIVLRLEMEGGPTSFDLKTGGAPFPLDRSGSWKYDDSAYPTVMHLNDGEVEYDLSFSVPPISGDQRFSLSFSLGCNDNQYVYEFAK